MSHGLRAWVGGGLWTILLLAGLFFLDRRVIAPEPAAEIWRRAGPDRGLAGAKPILLPAYLPSTLGWPPAEVWVRGGEQPGQWMGVVEEGGGAGRLWIGWGGGRLPRAIAGLEGCLEEGGLCPGGWKALSTTVGEEPERELEVQLLSNLGPEEARRILLGLSPARRTELP